MLLNTLLLVVFVGIVFSGIAVSTFLVGTEGNKRWIVYPVFCAICVGIFLFFKNTMNLNFLPWRNAYLIVTFYVSAVCTLMAFIAIPKTSLKALKESVVPAVSIFTIAGVLLMIY